MPLNHHLTRVRVYTGVLYATRRIEYCISNSFQPHEQFAFGHVLCRLLITKSFFVPRARPCLPSLLVVFFFNFPILSSMRTQVFSPTTGIVDFAISMRPDYHQAIIDTIRYYGWNNIIYLYNSHDGKSIHVSVYIHILIYSISLSPVRMWEYIIIIMYELSDVYFRK